MGGTAGGLGAALSGYATDRFGNPVDPAQQVQTRMKRRGILGAIGNGVARYRNYQQQAQQAAQDASDPATNDWAMQQMAKTNAAPSTPIGPNAGNGPVGIGDEIGGGLSEGEDLGMDAFGGGQIVTKPTIALLGDKGVPEIVRPLNSNPNNKVNTPVITRYRGAMR